jgi:hypothetical protein
MGVEIAADLPDIDHALLPLPTTGTPPEATSTHGKPFRAFTTGQPMPFAASVTRRPNPLAEIMMGVGVGIVVIASIPN